VELLHGIILNFLDLDIAIDAIPGDGKEDYYSQRAAHGDWSGLVSECETSARRALVHCNR
jgi:hypothetical protein